MCRIGDGGARDLQGHANISVSFEKVRTISSENCPPESLTLPQEKDWPGRWLQACKKEAETPAAHDYLGEPREHYAK